MPLIWLTVGLIILSMIWFKFIKPLSYWKRLGINQTKPWLIVGDTWPFFFKQKSMNDFIDWLYYIHPGTRYTGMYNLSSPVLLIKDPELIKQITVKDFESFVDHPPLVHPETDVLWGKNLLALTGDQWKEMRNTLTPTFTSSKIKNMYFLMLDAAENFVKFFLDKNEDVVEVEMKDIFTRYANDIIATTAFGIKVNSLREPHNDFYINGKRLSDFGSLFNFLLFLGHQLMPTVFKILRVPFLDLRARRFFAKVIDETIKAREEKNIVRPDMINILLEARKVKRNENNTDKTKPAKHISNIDIAAQAMIFFFAGFDTVSTAMSFTAYELAINKDIQDRLRKEIRKVSKSGKVSYDQLQEMKYLDMVVSEGLRKWPPFPQLDRVCTKPFTIQPSSIDEKPVPLKVNQEVWLPVYSLHRDPKYFPQPEKFDPERFSDENKSKIVPYTYFPFGLGPRNCIGNRFALLEVKVMICNLLLNFELLPTKKTVVPLILESGFTLRPKGGFWIGLKRIKD